MVKKPVILLCFTMMLLGTAFFAFRLRYGETIRQLAEIQVKNLTSDTVHSAVDRQIQRGSIHYDRIIFFEKDMSGRVSALRTNIGEVNRLKTEILNLINSQILSMDSTQMGIPFGSLVLPELFSGRGRKIPVSILSIRNSDAQFISQFTEAGINQTIHRLTMIVQVDIAVLVLGHTDHFEVSSQVVIAETIIVGRVPRAFIHTGGNYAEQ